MSKKKIAVIGVKGLPGYGGSARANDHILTRLADKYDFTVYAIDTHAKETQYNGMRQYIFKSYKSKKITSLLYYLKSLYMATFIHKHDLIHLNHSVSGFLLPLMKFKNFKTISSIRGLGYKDDDKWNYAIKRLFFLFEYMSFKLPDIVTTVQRSSVEYIEGKTQKPVYFIPNGVELNYKNYRNIKSKDVITFSAARIIYLKGCHDFLKALKEINYKGKIRIIGDLSHVNSYEENIIKLSEGLNIEFTGLIKDSDRLFKMIAESKLFVFPSYTEGMSNMLLEVASLNVPIIASDIPPNKDVFNNNEATFFEVGNHSDLAEKIMNSLNNSEALDEKSNNAIKKIKTEYNWDLISEKYDLIYEKLLFN